MKHTPGERCDADHDTGLCTAHEQPAHDDKLVKTCLNLDCPERTGGECTAGVNPHDDTNPINGSYKHMPGAEELSQEWMKEGMDDTNAPSTDSSKTYSTGNEDTTEPMMVERIRAYRAKLEAQLTQRSQDNE